MSWGLIMGYWSPAVDSFSEEFDISTDNITRKYKKILGDVYNMLAPGACIFGSPLINLVIKSKGRKFSSVVVAAVAFVSWILMGSIHWMHKEGGTNLIWLACIVRVFLGVSVGATSALIPMYITELAPSDLRGVFGTLHQFGISVGASCCYALGCIKQKGKSGIHEYLDWYKVAMFSAIPTGLHLIAIWFIPESPVAERVEEGKLSESLWQRKFLKPMTISMLLMFFQQFGGTSAFLANLSTIFDQSGSKLSSEVSCLLVGVAGALATLIGSPLIGLFGRKMCWNISSAFQFLALTLNAIQEKYQIDSSIPIICLFVDNFAFGIGTAPIPWFFVPELFPDSVRSFAAGLISGCCWIMGTVLFLVWSVMRDAKGFGQTGGFALFAGIMGLSLIFGLTILPEPKSQEMGGDIEQYDSRPLIAEVVQVSHT
jgi:MFS family permease